jgi:hypothetical protein
MSINSITLNAAAGYGRNSSAARSKKMEGGGPPPLICVHARLVRHVPARVELVRGNLQCRGTARPARDLRSPDFHPSAISSWDRLDPQEVAQIDRSRQVRKIDDVLLRELGK